MDKKPLKEYKFGNAVVRIHGNPPSRETLERACINFMRAVEAGKPQKGEDREAIA